MDTEVLFVYNICAMLFRDKVKNVPEFILMNEFHFSLS